MNWQTVIETCDAIVLGGSVAIYLASLAGFLLARGGIWG